jgi:hypothetical protein
MEKMKMHSPNLTQDNIARIRDLFPGCVTEAKGEDGGVKLAVDFDQLRQELAESIVEGPQERYHLNWPGKREALLTANAPIAKTLRPCREESVDFDTTVTGVKRDGSHNAFLTTPIRTRYGIMRHRVAHRAPQANQHPRDPTCTSHVSYLSFREEIHNTIKVSREPVYTKFRTPSWLT